VSEARNLRISFAASYDPPKRKVMHPMLAAPRVPAAVQRVQIMLDDSTVVDAIRGFRQWVFDPEDGVAHLTSIFHQARWPRDGALKASCRCNSLLDYHVCGIHAFSSADQLNWSWGCSGEVYLWGLVHRHEGGYRAQYAKVAALYKSPRILGKTALIEVAAKQYNVPLVQV
jgi:hypothetical protein